MFYIIVVGVKWDKESPSCRNLQLREARCPDVLIRGQELELALLFAFAAAAAAAAKSLQSCPTPSEPMDCSLQGSSVHGIFQARVLEWVAIAFPFAFNCDLIKIFN